MLSSNAENGAYTTTKTRKIKWQNGTLDGVPQKNTHAIPESAGGLAKIMRAELLKWTQGTYEELRSSTFSLEEWHQICAGRAEVIARELSEKTHGRTQIPSRDILNIAGECADLSWEREMKIWARQQQEASWDSALERVSHEFRKECEEKIKALQLNNIDIEWRDFLTQRRTITDRICGATGLEIPKPLRYRRTDAIANHAWQHRDLRGSEQELWQLINAPENTQIKSLYDAFRKQAYQEWGIKAWRRDRNAWTERCRELAGETQGTLNCTIDREHLLCVADSVSKWAWNHFDE